MPDLLWSFDQLARFTRFEDAEVRYWAAERLTALFPAEAADAVAGLVLDEHDTTPDLVADHLGRHGGARHVPLLLRGFRNGRGLTPGRCVEALARLRYEGTPQVAASALHGRDLSEGCLGIMVAALVELEAAGHPQAADTAREFLLRRPELFAEPCALKGAVRLFAPAHLPDLILKWLTGLHFRGSGAVEPCVRALLDELQLEDYGWCVRTDRSGRIDLDRTLKAVESGYDLDLRAAIAPAERAHLARQLQRGEFADIAACLAGHVRSRVASPRAGHADALPPRLDALAAAFQSPEIVRSAERLEPAVQQWLIGVLIAAVIKTVSYRNYQLEMDAAGRDLDRLLALAGVETSSLLGALPERLASSAAGRRDGLIDWCVRTLEARGPFFPKAVALETLGFLRAVDLVPEIADHVADENAYIYGAAERALARLGPRVIDHARVTLAGGGHPDAIQSLVRLACDQCRDESLALMLEHFDDIFETIGPEAASEAAGLLGHRDLVPHLRRWLDRCPAMVGHTLLLIGAIHNLPIPEEESILKAIDDYWKAGAEGVDGGGEPGTPSGQYLM